MNIRNAMLRAAYEGSFYTIEGAGGDVNDWKKGYTDLLKERGIGTISKWIEFTGKDMNVEFCLTGTNRYPDNIHFLAFPLTGLDVKKLAFFKLQMGDRWFNDIVDNNTRREQESAGYWEEAE